MLLSFCSFIIILFILLFHHPIILIILVFVEPEKGYGKQITDLWFLVTEYESDIFGLILYLYINSGISLLVQEVYIFVLLFILLSIFISYIVNTHGYYFHLYYIRSSTIHSRETSSTMATPIQLECNGTTQLLAMQVPQDMTRTHINRRVSEAIGMPNGSYSLFYLDDLTSSYQSLSLPEDYTPLAYIALYKGLCLSVQLEQHQL